MLLEREAEMRWRERHAIDLPCVLSIQSGWRTPRYVSVRGIQRASRMELTVCTPAAAPPGRLRLLRQEKPGEGAARMLQGSLEAMAAELADILRQRRGA